MSTPYVFTPLNPSVFSTPKGGTAVSANIAYAIAYALVQVTDDKPDPVTISPHGIQPVKFGTTPGIFEVNFEENYFSTSPAVTVTQVYNGGHDITNCGSYGEGWPSDNAVVVCIGQNSCRIKTGNGDQGIWRSFSIIAVGPPGSQDSDDEGAADQS